MSATDPTKPTADTIVFVHGLWMTPLSWEHWRAWFEARGWKTIAPAWPGFDRPVEELRADPGDLGSTTAGQVLDHYEAEIKKLETPPVIIGHSFGGAFTQVLIDRGLGVAGVPIAPAPLKGILDLPISTLRSSFGVLGNPLNFGKAVKFTPSQFKYAFGNTLSEEDSQAAWEKYAVPAASKVLFAGASANAPFPKTPLQVDWKAPKAPLFLLGGGEDHVVPSKVVKRAADKYKGGRVDFKDYPERSHFTVGEPGWESVIGDVAGWLDEVVDGPSAG